MEYINYKGNDIFIVKGKEFVTATINGVITKFIGYSNSEILRKVKKELNTKKE